MNRLQNEVNIWKHLFKNRQGIGGLLIHDFIALTSNNQKHTLFTLSPKTHKSAKTGVPRKQMFCQKYVGGEGGPH